jgi:glycine hydroxymethyltransferase
MILCKSDHAQAIDRAVFPGLQGARTMHTTAGIGRWRCTRRQQPGFKDYAHGIVRNARALAEELVARGYDLVSGGTDNHLILMDLSRQGVPGKVAAKALDKAGSGTELQLGPL